MLYKALWVTENTPGTFTRAITEKNTDDLPAGDLLINVHYSSLNYKDALSATGNKGITRQFPHTPGIDAAGTVVDSRVESFRPGDEVVVTGHDLGMNTPGGYGKFIRVPASWVVRKPEHLSLNECMVIGTAGFTAACALFKMMRCGIVPGGLPIVVTGSTGGVGSLAISLLAHAGFEVIATTGKSGEHAYLHTLGATRVETRAFVDDPSGRGLLRPQWSGAIDTVGGNTLHTLLRGCASEGCVVSTGLVQSPQLNTTVYPFILNGVSLLGVGSAETPMEIRQEVWNRLNDPWNISDKLATMATEVSLEELNDIWIDRILAGKVRGRILVRH